jgi:hypothetical protein
MALRGVTGDTSPARASANPLPHAKTSPHRHVLCAHLATCAPNPLPRPDPFVEFRHEEQATSASPRHAEPTSRNPTAAPIPRAPRFPPIADTRFPTPHSPSVRLCALCCQSGSNARKSAQQRATPYKRRRPRGRPRAPREIWQRGRRRCSRCLKEMQVKETQHESATVSSR